MNANSTDNSNSRRSLSIEGFDTVGTVVEKPKLSVTDDIAQTLKSSTLERLHAFRQRASKPSGNPNVWPEILTYLNALLYAGDKASWSGRADTFPRITLSFESYDTIYLDEHKRQLYSIWESETMHWFGRLRDRGNPAFMDCVAQTPRLAKIVGDVTYKMFRETKIWREHELSRVTRNHLDDLSREADGILDAVRDERLDEEDCDCHDLSDEGDSSNLSLPMSDEDEDEENEM